MSYIHATHKNAMKDRQRPNYRYSCVTRWQPTSPTLRHSLAPLSLGKTQPIPHCYPNTFPVFAIPFSPSYIAAPVLNTSSNKRGMRSNIGTKRVTRSSKFETAMFVCTGKEEVPKDNVTAIEFSPFVSEVGDFTYRNCKELKDMVLNEGLQKIGEGVFFECSSLDSIEFSSTISEIVYEAFGNALI